jgi:hypothetical protein
LLTRWRELLERPDYVAIQARPVAERPLAMASDQDVLNALLGSGDFAEVPIGVFGNGRDIIHSGGALGYSFTERLRGLFLPHPTFVHAISAKPWIILEPGGREPGRRGWFRRLMHEVSPYLVHARRYRDRLDEPCRWMDWHTPLGSVLRVAGLGHWALRGMPVSAVAAVLNRLGVR